MYHYDTCLLFHSFLAFARLDIFEGTFLYLCYPFILKQIISLCNLCVYCIAIRCCSATINLNNCSIFLLIIKILTISCLIYMHSKPKVETMPQCLCPQDTSYCFIKCILKSIIITIDSNIVCNAPSFTYITIQVQGMKNKGKDTSNHLCDPRDKGKRCDI
jgi:hypothetical protein